MSNSPTADLDYLLRKIENARFLHDPFLHIEIPDFFIAEQFEATIKDPQIRVDPVGNDKQLIDKLLELGFDPIPFPGTTTNVEHYLDWRTTRNKKDIKNDTCEGFGITFRLNKTVSPWLRTVVEFLSSAQFKATIAAKFGLDHENTILDGGIQKYLDGYEISPHPDIRTKALTWMVNINPDPASETLELHTHYMRFKPSYRYVTEYWRGNPTVQRCWTPWEWCETVKKQTKNNSLVMFAPDDDTMHAVKTQYNHLISQRTQIYGNLWYNEPHQPVTHWQSLAIPQIK